MLTIDRLRLRLPPGYEGRAESIALEVAEALSRSPVGGDRSLDSLTVGPVPIASGADKAVAADIAAAIQSRLATDLSALPASERREK